MSSKIINAIAEGLVFIALFGIVFWGIKIVSSLFSKKKTKK